MATDEEKVQVVIRVRPLLQKEIVKGCKSCIQILPDKLQVIIGKDRKFTFDQLLGQDTDQASTFEMCVKPLVEGCFQGYNATVFAYGQTGSGKTFTILGPDLVGWEDNSTQGIIPRAIGEIFKRVKEMANVQFSIRVSYLEVYQEELNDLLHMTTPSQDIHIRENEKGHTLLIGIQELVIHTVDDGLSLLEQGSAARHTGTTKMNERSSRSHTVFTLYLDQRIGSVAEGTDDMQYVSAKFHFVDLAGSERACRTGNEGARFKESIFINTGLLALGNVISALGDPKRRATHIPYRDSKITRILKGSLGGNSKTVMLTCLSPSEDSFAETLNSLKYANRARNICNKPVMNRDPHAVQMEEMQSQIEALKVELDRVHTAASSYSHHSNAMVNVEEHLQQLEEELARSKQHCSDYRLSAAKSKKLVEDIIEKGHVAEEEIDRLRQWIDFLSNPKCKSHKGFAIMVGSNDKKFGLAATVCNKIPLRAPDHWSGFDNISVITDVSDILVENYSITFFATYEPYPA
ncbi:kinesin-like protein KIF27 [Corticium candelabrum]|uniref:kinesin-like protein KIF27 n=1 Tax=Corticium candelabrum TaxID=121492 RepID=UPI002E26E7C0|nr:kinesin-like protein KIF27 [Corticium candelabrum]